MSNILTWKRQDSVGDRKLIYDFKKCGSRPFNLLHTVVIMNDNDPKSRARPSNLLSKY